MPLSVFRKSTFDSNVCLNVVFFSNKSRQTANLDELSILNESRLVSPNAIESFLAKNSIMQHSADVDEQIRLCF